MQAEKPSLPLTTLPPEAIFHITLFLSLYDWLEFKTSCKSIPEASARSYHLSFSDIPQAKLEKIWPYLMMLGNREKAVDRPLELKFKYLPPPLPEFKISCDFKLFIPSKIIIPADVMQRIMAEDKPKNKSSCTIL